MWILTSLFNVGNVSCCFLQTPPHSCNSHTSVTSESHKSLFTAKLWIPMHNFCVNSLLCMCHSSVNMALYYYTALFCRWCECSVFWSDYVLSMRKHSRQANLFFILVCECDEGVREAVALVLWRKKISRLCVWFEWEGEMEEEEEEEGQRGRSNRQSSAGWLETRGLLCWSL